MRSPPPPVPVAANQTRFLSVRIWLFIWIELSRPLSTSLAILGDIAGSPGLSCSPWNLEEIEGYRSISGAWMNSVFSWGNVISLRHNSRRVIALILWFQSCSASVYLLNGTWDVLYRVYSFPNLFLSNLMMNVITRLRLPNWSDAHSFISLIYHPLGQPSFQGHFALRPLAFHLSRLYRLRHAMIRCVRLNTSSLATFAFRLERPMPLSDSWALSSSMPHAWHSLSTYDIPESRPWYSITCFASQRLVYL